LLGRESIMPKKSSPPTSSNPPAAPKRRASAGAAPKQAALNHFSLSVPSEAIARRAYELFLEEGAVHGHDVDHWLSAERELQAAPAPMHR
jgi:hypothetical protein